MSLSNKKNGGNVLLIWHRLAQRFFDHYRSKTHLLPYLYLPEDLFAPKDPKQLFSTPVKKISIELGFGYGEVILQRALSHPQHGWIGFEIQKERIGFLLQKCLKHKPKNLLVLPLNFQWFFSSIFTAESIDAIYLYFPDPWPKKKHRKHRAMQWNLLEQASSLLKPKGLFEMTTDDGPYARHSLRLLRHFAKETRLLNPSQPEYFLYQQPCLHSEFERRKLLEQKRIYCIRYTKA